MGLHTIDTVRRDAAEKRIWFETRQLYGGDKIEIILTQGQTRLVYIIDIESDVVEKITFLAGNSVVGELEFSYLQNVDNVGYEFASPRTRSYRKSQQSPLGVLWLVKLINDRW
jgi:hypothetical protein